MENIGTIALITLLVTVLAGLAVEFIKRIKPKIKYSIKESIPIILDEKKVGANVIEISNPSSKSVKDIVLKIKAIGVDIRNGGVKTTTGLDYDVIENEDSLEIKIPFLKFKDYLSITTILEDRYRIPSKPDVTVRSPDNFTLTEESGGYDKKFSFIKDFAFAPAIVASTVVAATLFLDISNVRTEQGTNLALAA